jgi:hypothetical protein|tara:strand:+ start:46913 stop:47095 length:183 start_codon:yes stop_codon:yes gene_type:complete
METIMSTVQKIEVQRLQADLPKPLMKRLKMRAIEEETTVTKIVTDAVVSHLKSQSHKLSA